MYSVLSFPSENVRSSLAVVSSTPYSWDAVTCEQRASHMLYTRARSWCRRGDEPSSWNGRRKTAKRNIDGTREKVNSYVSGPFLSGRFSFERFCRIPCSTTVVFLRRRNKNACLKKKHTVLRDVNTVYTRIQRFLFRRDHSRGSRVIPHNTQLKTYWHLKNVSLGERNR